MKKNLIDLHTHSVLSRHAYSSLTENIEYALANGLKVYGISEHQPDPYGVGAHKYAFINCARLTKNLNINMKVLTGIELNILDGDFDLDLNVEKLDYCIASMHTYAYSTTHTSEENTNNYIKACNTSYIKIIGHMDNPAYPCDYEKVIIAAKENKKLIELNNESLDPNGSRKGAIDIDKTILSLCVKHNVPIILNSDAHIKYEIGNVDRCIKVLEEVNFPENLIVNYNNDLLMEYFNISIN